jgi:hypothetical protein
MADQTAFLTLQQRIELPRSISFGGIGKIKLQNLNANPLLVRNPG